MKKCRIVSMYYLKVQKEIENNLYSTSDNNILVMKNTCELWYHLNCVINYNTSATLSFFLVYHLCIFSLYLSTFCSLTFQTNNIYISLNIFFLNVLGRNLRMFQKYSIYEVFDCNIFGDAVAIRTYSGANIYSPEFIKCTIEKVWN